MNANLNLNWQIYRELNPDLIKANLNNEHQVTTHWTRYGQKENRKSKITDITPNFNWEIYKKQNPKLILRDQTEYELHWIKFGMEKCCNKIIENEIIENNAIDDKTIENEIKIITARTDEINEFNAKYGSREHKLRYHNSNKYNENYINRHNETNIITRDLFLDCSIDTDKIILLCCTGRSGSTTLQRIINTIPNSNICGENGGALNNLLSFYKNIKRGIDMNIPGGKNPMRYDELIRKNIKPCWYNSFNYRELVNNLKHLIIKMFKNSDQTTLWGCKEIRYLDNTNLIPEFKELFPQTKIIIQIRQNIVAQSKSGWFAGEESIPYLEKYNAELIKFYQQNKDYVYLSTFEDMFNLDKLAKIFEFIDCTPFYNKNKIDVVLSNKME